MTATKEYGRQGRTFEARQSGSRTIATSNHSSRPLICLVGDGVATSQAIVNFLRSVVRNLVMRSYPKHSRPGRVRIGVTPGFQGSLTFSPSSFSLSLSSFPSFCSVIGFARISTVILVEAGGRNKEKGEGRREERREAHPFQHSPQFDLSRIKPAALSLVLNCKQLPAS